MADPRSKLVSKRLQTEALHPSCQTSQMVEPRTRRKKLIPMKYSFEEIHERLGNGLCIFCDEQDSPSHQEQKHKNYRVVVMESVHNSHFDDDGVLDEKEISGMESSIQDRESSIHEVGEKNVTATNAIQEEETDQKKALLLEISQEVESKCILKTLEMVEMPVQENESCEVDESVMETYCDQQRQVPISFLESSPRLTNTRIVHEDLPYGSMRNKLFQSSYECVKGQVGAVQLFDIMPVKEHKRQQNIKVDSPPKTWKFKYKIEDLLQWLHILDKKEEQIVKLSKGTATLAFDFKGVLVAASSRAIYHEPEHEQTSAYDLILEVAMKAEKFQHKTLLIKGLWCWFGELQLSSVSPESERLVNLQDMNNGNLLKVEGKEEYVGESALRCFLNLIYDRGKVRRNRQKGLDPRVIKALLEIIRGNSWLEVVHSKLICIMKSMFYQLPELESSHKTISSASNLLIKQVDLIGCVEFNFLEYSFAATREERRNLYSISFDYVHPQINESCSAAGPSEYIDDEVQPLVVRLDLADALEAFYISVKFGVVDIGEIRRRSMAAALFGFSNSKRLNQRLTHRIKKFDSIIAWTMYWWYALRLVPFKKGKPCKHWWFKYKFKNFQLLQHYSFLQNLEDKVL